LTQRRSKKNWVGRKVSVQYHARIPALGAWSQDPEGFKKRVGDFLTIADRHHIQPLFVFFDDCWNKEPKAGKQPSLNLAFTTQAGCRIRAKTASFDTTGFPTGKICKGCSHHFAHDKRILLWDLYNEPGNNGKGDSSLTLVTKVFQWARDVNPDQPVSAGLWSWGLEKLNAFQMMNSDVITYHDYQEQDLHKLVIQVLKASGKPLICTEYMART
jgi:hypothetical protein